MKNNKSATSPSLLIMQLCVSRGGHNNVNMLQAVREASPFFNEWPAVIWLPHINNKTAASGCVNKPQRIIL